MAKHKFEFYRSIAAVPTDYGGRHYRSRTEARWAVFFDLTETPFQFEREHTPQPWLVGEKDPPKLLRDRDGMTIPVMGRAGVSLRALRQDWPSRRRPLWYLPDFYLTTQHLFLEIKPLIYGPGGLILPPMEKQEGLELYHHVEIITLCGGPSEIGADEAGNPLFLGLDNKLQRYTLWARCSVCGATNLSMGETFFCRRCREMGHNPEKDPEIQQALRDARLWQFDLE